MKHFFKGLSGSVLLAVALICPTLPMPAHAAQGYDNCTGFIDSLPATISTQGTWCLRHDLATSVATGAAITVATNNVTIDCNDFKIGGTAAGAGTTAFGITAASRLNTTVRHCNVRGFYFGIYLSGSTAGNVVEDNRLDGSTLIGIYLDGEGSVMRRNQVTDTGGSTAASSAYGLFANGSSDIVDNVVSGVSPGAGDAYGIYTNGSVGGSVLNNRVNGLVPASGTSFGIYNYSAVNVTVAGNVVNGSSLAGSLGLRCTGPDSRAKDNFLYSFATPISSCRDDGNSL